MTIAPPLLASGNAAPLPSLGGKGASTGSGVGTVHKYAEVPEVKR
jgi:hypothetical protein